MWQGWFIVLFSGLDSEYGVITVKKCLGNHTLLTGISDSNIFHPRSMGRTLEEVAVAIEEMKSPTHPSVTSCHC